MWKGEVLDLSSLFFVLSDCQFLFKKFREGTNFMWSLFMQTFFVAIEKRIKIAFQLQTEQKNQKLAIFAAIRNLKQHLQKLNEVVNLVTTKHSEFDKTIQNFDTNLQKVQSLHFCFPRCSSFHSLIKLLGFLVTRDCIGSVTL
jgi:hypothetical protein